MENEKALQPDSLSETFKSLAECNRAAIASLRPTLNAVSALIGQLQDIGLDQVGIEFASRDKLRSFNLLTKGSISDTAYMILSIYDTSHLIRIRPGQMIHCHAANLNKAGTATSDIDSFEFWHKGGSDESDAAERRFFQYDLSQPEDCLSFLTTTLRNAAICAAEDELKQFDRPVEKKATLLKQRQGQK